MDLETFHHSLSINSSINLPEPGPLKGYEYSKFKPIPMKGNSPVNVYMYSSTDDEKIRNAIPPLHGCLLTRVGWETSCMGSMEIQGALGVARKYIG